MADSETVIEAVIIIPINIPDIYRSGQGVLNQVPIVESKDNKVLPSSYM